MSRDDFLVPCKYGPPVDLGPRPPMPPGPSRTRGRKETRGKRMSALSERQFDFDGAVMRVRSAFRATQPPTCDALADLEVALDECHNASVELRRAMEPEAAP